MFGPKGIPLFLASSGCNICRLCQPVICLQSMFSVMTNVLRILRQALPTFVIVSGCRADVTFYCAPHVFWSLRTPARDSGPDQRGADYAELFETCRSSNTPQIAIGTGSGTGSAQLQLQFRSGTRKFQELQP